MIAGLTKLDWFAGLALQGILAGENSQFPIAPEKKVEQAYHLAKLMVNESEKAKLESQAQKPKHIHKGSVARAGLSNL